MYTPRNIFDFRDQPLPTKNGDYMIARINPVGGGWHIWRLSPDNPPEMVADNVDVWTACRVLNETTIPADRPGR